MGWMGWGGVEGWTRLDWTRLGVWVRDGQRRWTSTSTSTVRTRDGDGDVDVDGRDKGGERWGWGCWVVGGDDGDGR